MGDDIALATDEAEESERPFGGVNPYDFRNPITEAEFLAGRREEIDEATKHFRSAARGRPVHIALIGKRAAGKTSLLRVLQGKAEASKLLAVRLDLDEAVTSTPATFFKALFEAVVQALVMRGAIEEADPRYAAWLRQVHLGDTGVSPADQLLIFGMVASSLLHGAVHPDVSPSLLTKDCGTLTDIAAAGGFKGIVVLCDEGDLIGGNAALIQKLRNLLQSLDRWMLVAAGTRAMFDRLTDVFSPIPRQFVRIPVEPFDDLQSVHECITAPLRQRGIRFRIPIETVVDLFRLTGGSPYELNLVCYHIWEELDARRQMEFGLSTRVLDAVLGEIREFGRQISADDVEAIRTLTIDDRTIAGRVIPFEDYTVREIALSRLLPNDFSKTEYDETVNAVRRDIHRMSSLQIVDIDEEERFRFRGDTFAQTYLKYSAELRGVLGLATQRYPTLVGFQLLGKACSDLLAHDGVTGLGTRGRQFSLDSTGIENHLLEVGRAMSDRDIGALAKTPYIPPFYDHEEAAGMERAGLLFLGLIVTVDGLTPVEAGQVLFNVNGVDSDEWARQVEEWVAGNEGLLRNYGVELMKCVTATLDPIATNELLTFLELTDGVGRALNHFRRERYGRCVEVFATAVEGVEEHVEGDPETSGLRDELAEALNRLGFVAAIEDDLDIAKSALERALQLGHGDIPWLPQYNLACVAARRNDFRVAADLASVAYKAIPRETFEGESSAVWYMLMAPPTPSDWEGRSGVAFVELPQSSVRQFVHLQAHAFGHLANEADGHECDRLVENVDEEADAALHRLSGWILLSILDDPETAVEHFRIAGLQPGASPACADELAYALRVLRQRENGGTMESGPGAE